jgi:GAF domain-containing protein
MVDLPEDDPGVELSVIANEIVRRDTAPRDGGLLAMDLLSAAVKIIKADKGTLRLFEKERWKLLAQIGFERPYLDYFEIVEKRRGACGTAMEQGRRIIVEDVTQSPIFTGSPALEVMLAAGVRAVQSTPLISQQGKVMGLLSTHFREVRHLKERDCRLLDLLAGLAGKLLA